MIIKSKRKVRSEKRRGERGKQDSKRNNKCHVALTQVMASMRRPPKKDPNVVEQGSRFAVPVPKKKLK